MILLQTALTAASPFLLNMTVNLQFLALLNQQNTKRPSLCRNKTKQNLSTFFVKTNGKEEHLVILAKLVLTYHGVVHHYTLPVKIVAINYLQNCVLILQLLSSYHVATLRQPGMSKMFWGPKRKKCALRT